jgi:hypothetical protein
MMKKYYLVALLVIVPLFAGQVTLDEAILDNPNVQVLDAQAMSVPFTPNPDETLSHGGTSFVNSLGIYGDGSVLPQNQTIGFATYYILSEHGISTPQEAVGVLLYWGTVNVTMYNFRLYLWNNVASAMLRPLSHGTHLYYDSLGTLGASWNWAYYDVSAAAVAVPETVWVGVCYNHMANGSPADWYYAYDATTGAGTTYGNLSGGSTNWQTFTQMGYSQYDHVYGCRLVVTEVSSPDTNDVGPVSIDIPANVPWNTILPPQATIKNFGNVTETFEVTCEIEPGGYSSTDSVIDLAAGDSTQVTFTPDFTFAMEDTYTVTVYTQLAGDMDTSNDTMVAKIATYDGGVADGDWNVPKDFRFTTPAISSGKTTIEFALPVAAHVDLQVYDAMGRLSATVFSQKFNAGTHTMTLDNNLPAGVYFYKLNTDTGENAVTKSVMID